jgi:hypothetical protein
MRDQHDPDLDTIADLQRSITTTLGYLLGRCSVAELFGLQAYLSQLASHVTPPTSQEQSAAQMREMHRQQVLADLGPLGINQTRSREE